MDYFGIMDTVFPENVVFCLSIGCNNKNCVYDDFSLPYCFETCMIKNVEHLITENLYLKKEIKLTLSSSKFNFGKQNLPNHFKEKISPKRKREETFRKGEEEPLNKKLSF